MYFAAFFFVVVGVLVMWICQITSQQRMNRSLHCSTIISLQEQQDQQSEAPQPRWLRDLTQQTLKFLRTTLLIEEMQRQKM
jgi:hypothetical protein